MTKPHAFIVAFTTLALFGVAIYGSYLLIRQVVIEITELDEKVSVAVIAACATVFASVATVVYTQQRTKAREIDNSHRPQKVEIYKNFMEKAVVEVLRASKEKRFDTPEFQKELEELFFKFTGDLMVWGSPAVIRAYSRFRSAGGSPDVVLLMDDMLQAMRKDLGNSNWGLSRGDLIKLFLTDPENLEKLLKK